jgi:hypothetical protein
MFGIILIILSGLMLLDACFYIAAGTIVLQSDRYLIPGGGFVAYFRSLQRC